MAYTQTAVRSHVTFSPRHAVLVNQLARVKASSHVRHERDTTTTPCCDLSTASPRIPGSFIGSRDNTEGQKNRGRKPRAGWGSRGEAPSPSPPAGRSGVRVGAPTVQRFQHSGWPLLTLLLIVDYHSAIGRARPRGTLAYATGPQNIDASPVEMMEMQWLKWFCEAGGGGLT